MTRSGDTGCSGRGYGDAHSCQMTSDGFRSSVSRHDGLPGQRWGDLGRNAVCFSF